MSASYNLRSSGGKKELKCYLQRLSENSSPQDFSPEVRLERLKILDVPEQENFRFYVEQDRIVRKQSPRRSNKKILLLISFTVILFSLFLIYWQNELQICGFTFYRKFNNLQSSIKDYYFEKIDFYKQNIEKCLSGFVKKAVKEEKCTKFSQNKNLVDAFDEGEIKDFMRSYIAASKHENITPKLPFIFIDDQCRMDGKPILTQDSHMEKYVLYNSTYFESGNLTDYALASQGAKIVSIFETEPYGVFTVPFLNYDFGPLLSYVLLGNLNSFSSKGPTSVIIPWQKAGDCWAFKGSHGRIQIQLSQKVVVTAVTIDHIPRNLSPNGNVLSAPKKFSVFGLTYFDDQTTKQYLGSYQYDVEGPPMQTFSVGLKMKTPINNIEFIIESNQGNKIYTCLYKIRVHGYS